MKGLTTLGSFRGTLLFVWILLQMLILGLIAFFSTYVTTKNLEDNLTFQIEQLTPLLNTALTTPILQKDYASVISIATEFSAAGNIAKISVFDSNKKLITTAQNPAIDQRALERESTLIDIPLAFDQSKLGSAEVWVSRLRLIKTQQEITTITIVIFGGGTFTVCYACF